MLHLRGLQDLKMQRCITAIKPEAKRILEIGCGIGTHINSIKYHYPTAEAFGCDINPHEIKRGLNLNKENKIKHLACDALFLPYKDETFDMIIMVDVFEHLLDVKTTLREIGRVLKEGGELYCHIPCEGNPFTLHWFLWKLKLPGYKLKEKICGHIQRFTFNNVIHLIKLSGFEINSIQYMYHPIGQIMDILSWIPAGIRNTILSWISIDIRRLYNPSSGKSDSNNYAFCFQNISYKQIFLVPLSAGFKEIKNNYKKSKSFFRKFLMIFLSLITIFSILSRTLFRSMITLLSFLSYYESKIFHKSRLSMGIDIICRKTRGVFSQP